MKIYFQTFGCRLNQSETAVLQNVFAKKGCKAVKNMKDCNIAVINTCTVTQKADKETRKSINKIVRENPKAKIALIGCQAQLQKEKLSKLPNVCWIIGTAKKLDIADIILQQTKDTPVPEIIVPSIPRETFKNPAFAVYDNKTRAHLKVQDGCDEFCSFCEIPFARGRARSREFIDIIKEANTLVNNGHKEIVITGVNVGKYSHKNNSLADIIDSLEQIKGLERIRISSIELGPQIKSLLKKMTPGRKLCRYLHMPLQSANNNILKLMNRKYTYENFKETVDFAKAHVPQICIGTDIIVGFPGENNKLFEEAEEKLDRLDISYIHVFSYSERNFAKSKGFPGKITVEEIKKRNACIRGISTTKRKNFYRTLLNTAQNVLFEERGKDAWSGLTDNFIKVTTKSKSNLKNKLLAVHLEKLCKNGIQGELV